VNCDSTLRDTRVLGEHHCWTIHTAICENAGLRRNREMRFTDCRGKLVPLAVCIF
jgi:hypothetical protein